MHDTMHVSVFFPKQLYDIIYRARGDVHVRGGVAGHQGAEPRKTKILLEYATERLVLEK